MTDDTANIPTHWDNGDAKNLATGTKGVGSLVVLNVLILLVLIVAFVLGWIAYDNLDEHVSNIDVNTTTVRPAP